MKRVLIGGGTLLILSVFVLRQKNPFQDLFSLVLQSGRDVLLVDQPLVSSQVQVPIQVMAAVSKASGMEEMPYGLLNGSVYLDQD